MPSGLEYEKVKFECYVKERRGVFRALTKIHDGPFFQNSARLKTINYSRKKLYLGYLIWS